MSRFQTMIVTTILSVSFFGWMELANASAFKKVFIVILENTDYSEAMAQPFMAQLASSGASLDNFHGVIHPSQGNYIALTAGSTHGVNSNWKKNLDVKHIGDLLEAQGKSWKVYAEDYPGNCFTGGSKGKYVRKHVPFISYVNIQKDSVRCRRSIVDASTLRSDIENATLPDYSFYVPNLNNDGHDTGVKFADQWLEKTFGPLLGDARFMTDMLFVVTFDEDGGSKSNQIYTVLYGPGVIAGVKSNAYYTHYDLLRTIEDGLGVGNLGLEDAKARPIEGVWSR